MNQEARTSHQESRLLDMLRTLSVCAMDIMYDHLYHFGSLASARLSSRALCNAIDGSVRHLRATIRPTDRELWMPSGPPLLARWPRCKSISLELDDRESEDDYADAATLPAMPFMGLSPQQLQRFTCLVLRGDKYSLGSCTAVSALAPRLPGLREVVLEWLPTPPSDNANSLQLRLMFDSLASLPHLEALTLPDCRALQHAAPLARCTSLRRLEVRHTDDGDFNAPSLRQAHLQVLPQLVSLHKLVFRGCQLGSRRSQQLDSNALLRFLLLTGGALPPRLELLDLSVCWHTSGWELDAAFTLRGGRVVTAVDLGRELRDGDGPPTPAELAELAAEVLLPALVSPGQQNRQTQHVQQHNHHQQYPQPGPELERVTVHAMRGSGEQPLTPAQEQALLTLRARCPQLSVRHVTYCGVGTPSSLAPQGLLLGQPDEIELSVPLNLDRDYWTVYSREAGSQPGRGAGTLPATAAEMTEAVLRRMGAAAAGAQALYPAREAAMAAAFGEAQSGLGAHAELVGIVADSVAAALARVPGDAAQQATCPPWDLLLLRGPLISMLCSEPGHLEAWIYRVYMTASLLLFEGGDNNGTVIDPDVGAASGGAGGENGEGSHGGGADANNGVGGSPGSSRASEGGGGGGPLLPKFMLAVAPLPSASSAVMAITAGLATHVTVSLAQAVAVASGAGPLDAVVLTPPRPAAPDEAGECGLFCRQFPFLHQGCAARFLGAAIAEAWREEALAAFRSAAVVSGEEGARGLTLGRLAWLVEMRDGLTEVLQSAVRL